MNAPTLRPEDRDAAAGEYVLGTLSAEEHAAFVQQLAVDTDLQALVYAWQDHLLGLARHAAPVEPPATLWPRIEQRLGATPLPAATRPSAPANQPSWRLVRLWQSASGFAAAAAVALAVLLVQQPPADAPAGPRYLAVLQGPDKDTGWVVEVTAGDRVRLVPIGTTAEPPEGKTLQFWTKAEGATGPTSLGLVRTGAVYELPAQKLPQIGERQLFELTLEPAGGSPIGRPTGPVLFLGKSVRM